VCCFVAQFDVRDDEEQSVKLEETANLLLAAGYFRARIKGLSPFDKVRTTDSVVFQAPLVCAPQRHIPNGLVCVPTAGGWRDDLVHHGQQRGRGRGPALPGELHHRAEDVGLSVLQSEQEGRANAARCRWCGAAL
jgi:hypothetical protein